MTSNRWTLVRAVVEAAMQLPPEERLAYVQAQPLDSELRAEVDQLLGYDRESSAIFAVEGWRMAADGPGPGQGLEGQVVGSYRLIEEIGRGGMGAVYLAERADGEYQLQVAVKIMREGLFTAGLVKQFREERQILARLSHPGIARMLDGGITPDNRPFLVLEHVKGLPIDQYCVTHQLSTELRLRLFLRAAEAVQSAHQSLVLHLDLKPANILVTETGEPRLLDFGISRLLSEGESGLSAAEATLHLLTPRYASPEQALGAPLSVASDVFSLATLLYKMLTGRLPYPIEDAAPLEAARILRDVQPIAPSEAAPPELAAELRGDLDTILLQALRKEPERRYPTVAAFAADIRRYLESEPVEAHADSFGYRAQKFLRRNRVGVAAAAVVLAIVSLSVGAVVRSAVVARRERATAERRLGDVRALAHSYIFDLIPELGDIEGTLGLRHKIAKQSMVYLEAMSKEQSSDPDLERELATGYELMGRLQANSFQGSLGDRAAGEAALERALTLERGLVARDPKNMVDHAHLMNSLALLGNMRVQVGDVEAGQALHHEAWEVGQAILADGPKSTQYMNVANPAWHMSMNLAGEGTWNFADPEPSLDYANKCQAVMEGFAKSRPPIVKVPLYVAQLANVQNAKADALVLMGRSDEAIAIYKEWMPKVDRELLGKDRLSRKTVRSVHQRYGRLLLAHGDLTGATEMSKGLRPSARLDAGEVGNHVDELLEVADLTGWTAILDLRNGRMVEGRKEMQECLALYRSLRKTDPGLVWQTIGLVHYLLDFADLPQTDAETAAAMYAEALGNVTQFRAGHPTVLSAQVDEARAHAGLQRVAKVERKPEEAEQHKAAARALLVPVVAARPALVTARQMLEALDN